MSELRVVVVPVGRVDRAEVQSALRRVSKVLRRPLELRRPAPVPRSAEDTVRGQYRAGPMLAALRRELVGLGVDELVGADVPGTPVPTPSPDATVFVTDVDLYTPSTSGVLGDMDVQHRAAVLSIRRLREAFYRRKADPAKQRARLVKEILRVVGRLVGLADCGDPGCALATTVALADIDRKAERYCARCWKHLSSGAFRI